MKIDLKKIAGASAAGIGLFVLLGLAASPGHGLPTMEANDNGSSGESAPQEAAGADASATAAEIAINGWPDDAKLAARRLIDKYGQPKAALEDRLIWINNGPFEETVAFRDGVAHNFPTAHMDYVKQCVAYKVPVDKVGELSRFDGSLEVERTKGRLAASGSDEAMNLLALNLADDIVNGRKSVSEARRFAKHTVQLTLAGKSSAYMDDLKFKPESVSATGDADAASEPTAPTREKAR